MKLKPGFIYFLKEYDLQKEKSTEYVKIGLTNYDRPVASRILDHQTGNPRRIIDHESFEVASVDETENVMHHVFSVNRVIGEWFRLSDKQLAESIQYCKEFDKKIRKNVKNFQLVDELSNKESCGKLKKATTKEQKLVENYKNLISDLTIAKFNQEMAKKNLLVKMKNYFGVQDIITITEKHIAGSFATSEFKKEFPDLYGEYCITESKLVRSLKLSDKETKKDLINKIQADQLKELNEQIKEFEPGKQNSKPAQRTKELEKLHFTYLKTRPVLRELEIEKLLLECQIKTVIGDHDGLLDLCTWKSESKESISFNKDQFFKDHPEIVQRFMKPDSVSYSTRIEEGRAYKF